MEKESFFLFRDSSTTLSINLLSVSVSISIGRSSLFLSLSLSHTLSLALSLSLSLSIWLEPVIVGYLAVYRWWWDWSSFILLTIPLFSFTHTYDMIPLVITLSLEFHSYVHACQYDDELMICCCGCCSLVDARLRIHKQLTRSACDLPFTSIPSIQYNLFLDP